MKVRRLMATAFITFIPSVLGHFYLEICVPLDHFIDISKGLWRSEDYWPESSLFKSIT
ncbi:hypothetical protein E2C01_070554 [Portunus trituberculatus]|uniref:Uncharacterized protein n=1 Tax=Portunus trituberculatus TaxID=210409 RepID=A0A5B7I2L6_PORTR|nr:hypothetical protein [Portunus trituberculatus]